MQSGFSTKHCLRKYTLLPFLSWEILLYSWFRLLSILFRLSFSCAKIRCPNGAQVLLRYSSSIDRTSFREFLNIHTVSDVPDKKTVWACKNKLVKAGVFDTLFDDFRQLLDAKGLSFNEGKIITPSSLTPPGSATLAGKTLPSRTAREMNFGTTSHTRNTTRTLTHVGLRNGMRNIMDTKVIRRLTRNQNL